MTVTTSPLETLHTAVEKWLHIPAEDKDIIDIVIATYCSNAVKGDKLWLMVVDSSGGGKTELLRTFRDLPDAYFLSRMTPKSLVSGYRDKDNAGKDPSILPYLNEKVLVIKDFSPILSMRSDDRKEILSTFRDIYDGFSDNATGNLGKTSYEVAFTCIVAVTQAIENFQMVEQELGERFIKIRGRDKNAIGKVERAFVNACTENGDMRTELRIAVREFLESIPRTAQIVCSQKVQRDLIEAATFTASARSHVARDRSGNLLYHPRPEVGTRLVKEFYRLAISLAIVRGHDEVNDDDLRTVLRVAGDCVPVNRQRLIEFLRENPESGTLEISARTGMAYTTCLRTLDDLYVLDLLTRAEIEGDNVLGKKYLWGLRSPTE